MTRKHGLLWLVVAMATLFLLASVAAAAGGSADSDRVLSKITYIHYKKAHAKPPQAGGGKGGGKTQEGYYAYIANGAKWKTAEEIRINPNCGENVGGALDSVILGAVGAGMSEWETPGTATFNMYEGLFVDITVSYDDGAYRGYNTISFGSYSDPQVIAMTTVWGYFSGPPSNREIIEAHILFNDAFEWGDASADGDGNGSPDTYLMDIQNIATHELGHWVGMGDVYQTGATDETMYGYSTEGETKKRDLYKGDISGVTKLYQ